MSMRVPKFGVSSCQTELVVDEEEGLDVTFPVVIVFVGVVIVFDVVVIVFVGVVILLDASSSRSAESVSRKSYNWSVRKRRRG